MNNNILKSFSNFDEIQKSSLEPFELDESEILKGKKVPIGTITNGYKKIAEGKWQKVSEHGMTKKEHQETADTYSNYYQQNKKDFNLKQVDKHAKYANDENFDDKEYDDAHVEESLKVELQAIKQDTSIPYEERKKKIEQINNHLKEHIRAKDEAKEDKNNISKEISKT